MNIRDHFENKKNPLTAEERYYIITTLSTSISGPALASSWYETLASMTPQELELLGKCIAVGGVRPGNIPQTGRPIGSSMIQKLSNLKRSLEHHIMVKPQNATTCKRIMKNMQLDKLLNNRIS